MNDLSKYLIRKSSSYVRLCVGAFWIFTFLPIFCPQFFIFSPLKKCIPFKISTFSSLWHLPNYGSTFNLSTDLQVQVPAGSLHLCAILPKHVLIQHPQTIFFSWFPHFVNGAHSFHTAVFFYRNMFCYLWFFCLLSWPALHCEIFKVRDVLSIPLEITFIYP